MAATQDPKTQTKSTEGQQTLGDAIRRFVSWVDIVNDLQHPKPADSNVVIEFLRRAFEKEFTNSQTSSVPPASDPNRPLKSKAAGKKKPGGQPGHPGSTLELVDNPDRQITKEFDRSLLPAGNHVVRSWFVRRQVVDCILKKIVTEYLVEIVVDDKGIQYEADAPVKAPVQYGNSFRALAIELAVMQMLPLRRESKLLNEHFSVPFSEASIVASIRKVSELLQDFDLWVRRSILNSLVAHFDETGIKLSGVKYWIHVAATSQLVYFAFDGKRGNDATDAMGILPAFKGVAVHDCWAPYFKYACEHAVCGAHLLRELEGVLKRDPLATWAARLQDCLREALQAKKDSETGAVPDDVYERFRVRYRSNLTRAEKQCGLRVNGSREPLDVIWGKKGRKKKKTKTQNLVLRLRDLETEVLLFLRRPEVPFTNNEAERDLRMVKTKAKVSGGFRSLQAGQDFCRVRSYLYTCQLHGIQPFDALMALLSGKLPDFINLDADLPQLKIVLPTPQNQNQTSEEGNAKTVA